jgi:hypothetical protein
MQEIWRDIKDYEGLYQISNLGRVKSVERIVKRGTNFKPVRERVLKMGDKDGYKYVILSKSGKTKTGWIHRLVAQAFIPNPDDLPCINHKDENPSNNHVNNLEWCTHSYNNSYNDIRIKAARNKRKPIIQYSKDGTFIREWSHAREASEALGLSKRAIYECCVGRSKTSGGYIWKRKENMK